MLIIPRSGRWEAPATSGWTPADDASMFRWWLDPADATTRTMSGSDMTQISDKLGNIAGDFVVGGTPVYPTMGTQNGEDVFSWTQTTDAMNSATPATIEQEDTVFTCFRVDTGQTFFGFMESAATFKSIPLAENGSGSPDWLSTDQASEESNITVKIDTVDQGWGAATTRNTVYDAHVTGFWQLVEYEFTSTSGGQVISDVDIVHGTSSYRWDGLQGDIIIANSTITAAVREKVEGYLAHKYGLTANLPGGHPYKSSAP